MLYCKLYIIFFSLFNVLEDTREQDGASYKLHQFCMTGVGAVAMKVKIFIYLDIYINYTKNNFYIHFG